MWPSPKYSNWDQPRIILPEALNVPMFSSGSRWKWGSTKPTSKIQASGSVTQPLDGCTLEVSPKKVVDGTVLKAEVIRKPIFNHHVFKQKVVLTSSQHVLIDFFPFKIFVLLFVYYKMDIKPFIWRLFSFFMSFKLSYETMSCLLKQTKYHVKQFKLVFILK